jgi:GABA(A) receptor-associated protein
MNDNKELPFKERFTYDERVSEATRIHRKYPNRIPVICERAERSTIQQIDKQKYLVPADLTVGQFAYVIRKRLKLTPEIAIFILVNNTFPSTSTTLSTLYEQHKDSDGYIYLEYSGESTFGDV